MLKQPAGFWHLFGVDLMVRTAYQMGKTPVLPLLAASIGAGQVLIGTIVAVSTITGMITKPFVGLLSDRWGRRLWFFLGLALFAGTPFLYRFVETPDQLLALRLFHGTATAIFGPVTLAVVAEMDRAGLALFAAGVTLAFVVFAAQKFNIDNPAGASSVPFVDGAVGRGEEQRLEDCLPTPRTHPTTYTPTHPPTHTPYRPALHGRVRHRDHRRPHPGVAAPGADPDHRGRRAAHGRPLRHRAPPGSPRAAGPRHGRVQ
jgi:hypothetical protein